MHTGLCRIRSRSSVQVCGGFGVRGIMGASLLQIYHTPLGKERKTSQCPESEEKSSSRAEEGDGGAEGQLRGAARWRRRLAGGR